MEVAEAKESDLYANQTAVEEPVVKIEPQEDVKDLGDLTKRVDVFKQDEDDVIDDDEDDGDEFEEPSLVPSSTLWSFLIKRTRYLYQMEHGRKMDCTKLTKTLLIEVEQLLEEVSGFVRSCCSLHPKEDSTAADVVDGDLGTRVDEQHQHQPPEENRSLAIDERLALSLLGQKAAKLRVNEFISLSSTYQGDLFAPLKSKYLVSVSLFFFKKARFHPVFNYIPKGCSS
jgi:hypothetical protein